MRQRLDGAARVVSLALILLGVWGVQPARGQGAGGVGTSAQSPDGATVAGNATRDVHGVSGSQTPSAGSVAKFLLGGAAALGLHESGHVATDFLFDANPGVKGVHFGPIPFFAITHRAGLPPRREFTISSAGFWVQHLGSEVILSRRPDLRLQRAPFTKGVLAFNVLASVAYAGAAIATTGPPERDTRGMAVSVGMKEPAVGAFLLAPALLDAARYFHPRNRWLTWTSRAAKVGMLVLVTRAGR